MASALADVRTTHDAWPADEGYGYRDRRDYDEHEDPGDSAEYQINDLINTEVSLTHWTGPDAARLEELAGRGGLLFSFMDHPDDPEEIEEELLLIGALPFPSVPVVIHPL